MQKLGREHMPLSYKVKSIIDAMNDGEVNVIAHQANCFHKMGSGIAPLIANEWYMVSVVDRQTKKGEHRKLGTFSKVDIGNKYVYNLYGQYYPGANTDYSALKQALQAMSADLAGEEGIVIGLPKIGCGIGGGDWTVVSKLIEEALWQFPVTIYVLDESEIPLQ